MRKVGLILLAFWFLLAGASMAYAGPLPGIFLALGNAIAGLGVIGKLILGVALNLAATLLQKALAPKPKEPGIQADATIGGDNPLSINMGSFGTAGQLEYANTWGNVSKTPNAFCVLVFSIADLPMALTGLWVDDRKIALPDMSGAAPTPQGWPVLDFRKSGVDYLWVKAYDGTQVAADSYLVNKFSTDPVLPWDPDQIGRGVPYVIVTARFNTKIFTGPPSLFFESSGIRLYDISKDSTAGGSGTQRWNDTSTWQPSNNPVVHVYNIIRGVRYGSEWVYGGQTTQSYQLPSANWIAGINACNQAIPLAGGGTEPRYRSGCQINVDQVPLSVIESLLKGCSSRLAEVGGIYKILVGTPPVPVYSLTDETIIVTSQQTYDPFPGLESTFNGAQAVYPEPAEQWASKDAPAYFRPDLEVLDDNRRLVSGIQYATVPYAVQVQRLLKEAIEDSRRFRVHQIVLPPDSWLLEPNDVVAWSSARNGYTNKEFIIVGMDGASNLCQLVTLKEVDPSDFSWDPLVDEKSYSTGVLAGPIIPPPQPVTGWQVFPGNIPDDNGVARRPSIEVRFDGDLDDVEEVWIQVRTATGHIPVFDGRIPYGNPDLNPNPKSVVLNGVFTPNTDYEVRGQYVPFSDREAEWSSWLPVTTDDIRLGMDDLYPIDVGDLIEELGEWMDWIGNSYRDVQDQLDSLDAHVASIALQANSNIQTVRQELASIYQDSVALFSSEIIAATGPDSALVRRMDQYDVSLAGKASVSALQTIGLVTTSSGGVITGVGTAITQISAQLPGKANITALQSIGVVATNSSGQISGLGTAITGIQAQIDGVTAQSTFRMQAGLDPGSGYTARIGMEARISAAGTFRAAGLFIDVNASQARIVFNADQIAVMAGGTLAALFTAGTTYIQTARIRDLTAVNIRAKSLNADEIILNGTILTALIGANQVTRVAVASLASSLSLTTTYANVVSVVASSAISGSRMLIFAFIKTAGPNTGGFGLYFRLLRNGSSIIQYADITSEPNNFASTFTFVDTPGAGNHTYLVQMRKTESPAATVTAATLAVLEVKR